MNRRFLLSLPVLAALALGGVSVAGELYLVPDEVWWDIEIGEPPDLYRGRVELADGRDIFGIRRTEYQLETSDS